LEQVKMKYLNIFIQTLISMMKMVSRCQKTLKLSLQSTMPQNCR